MFGTHAHCNINQWSPGKSGHHNAQVSPDNTHQQSQLKPAQVASMQYVAVAQLPSCV